MEYIILAAGIGTRLYPYTKNTPKCLVKVTNTETILERTIKLIREMDSEASINIIVGFQHQKIEELAKGCNIIFNPFYAVTNSIASLWFARDILQKKQDVVILNGDIVFSRKFAREICSRPDGPMIYYDSSIKSHGDYNVQIMNGRMVVMGKELEEYEGEYVGITKYNSEVLPLILDEIDNMIEDGLFDQWYENALVQMSLNQKLTFEVRDAADHHWSEIDSIDNLLKIRKIISREY